MPRADAAIADLAVHGIGEIDRRGAARQLDQLALRREAEHLVLVELELGVFEKLVRRGGVFENFQQVLHPAELFQIRLRRVGLLVQPMRGDAVFRDHLHVRRADLNLDFLVARMA